MLGIIDLARQLEVGHRGNRIVERYLADRVEHGLTCGHGSAQDIKIFIKKNKLPVEFSRNLILKINWMIKDYLHNQDNYTFKMKLIDGNRLGFNFAWWLKNETKNGKN